MQTLESLVKEIEEKNKAMALQNKMKADHFAKAIEMFEATALRVIEKLKAAQEEMTRSMNQDDIKERDGKSL